MTAAQRAASILRHLPYLLTAERASFAPTSSEQAVQQIARRMFVRLPGSAA